MRAILIHGRGKVATDVCSAVLQPSLNQPEIRNLFGKIHDLSKKKAPKDLLMGHANKEIKELGTHYTLGEWCDQTFGTNVQDQINTIEGEHIHYVTDVLDRIKASGYTVFSNISGKGHSGFHEGHLMFNDTSSLQMILTVVPEEKLDPILSGIKPFLDRHSGSLLVIDASVLRPDHFDSTES